MADLAYTPLYTRYNTRLRDIGDVTWTPGEKAEYLKTAINDPYVYIIDKDTLTSVANQSTYPYSGVISTVMEVQIDLAADGYPSHLDKRNWDFINGNLIFSKLVKAIPASKTITLIGKRQLTNNDVIPEFLQDYILELALAEAFEAQATTLGSRFLANDVSMSELINKANLHRRNAQVLRKNLQNRYLMVL